MAKMKTASVHVRIKEDTKKQAEAILEELGISRSVAIEMFYRQIILNKGIPFDVAIPNASRPREELTKEGFDKMMQVAVEQVEKGQTTPVEEVFEELYQGVE